MAPSSVWSRTVTNSAGVQVEDTRIAVVMVGLPARGKSLIAQKGMLYLHRFIHSIPLILRANIFC